MCSGIYLQIQIEIPTYSTRSTDLKTNCKRFTDSTFEKITDQKTLSRTVRIGFKAKVSEQILQRGYYRDNLPEVLHGLGNGALNVVFTTVHNASSFQKEVDAELYGLRLLWTIDFLCLLFDTHEKRSSRFTF